MTTITHVYRRH